MDKDLQEILDRISLNDCGLVKETISEVRELPKDIVDEMRIRFNSDYDSAHKILTEYLSENEYLDADRIIRCVIFLADDGIETFKSSLDSAKKDPRDVMYWAEYEGDFKNHKVERIRDFNKPFEQNNI